MYEYSTIMVGTGRYCIRVGVTLEDNDTTAFRRRKRRLCMYDYDWLSEDWECMIACTTGIIPLGKGNKGPRLLPSASMHGYLEEAFY